MEDPKDDYFLLSDIEGDDKLVEKMFPKVLKGAEEVYFLVSEIFSQGIPPSCESDALSFDDSQFKTYVKLIKSYVMQHKCDYKKTEVGGDLFGPIHTLYTMWKWSLELESNMGDATTTSDDYRYFSLFVQGAWWRLNVDANNILGDYQPKKGVLDTQFTIANLSLLCSLQINAPDSNKRKGNPRAFTVNIGGVPVSIPTVTFKKTGSMALSTPDVPEMEYVNRGKNPRNPNDVVLHDVATEWLEIHLRKHYTKTTFTKK